MNNKLNETMKRLDRAYKLLSAIFLNEDNVDLMAEAKKELRGVYVELQAIGEKKWVECVEVDLQGSHADPVGERGAVGDPRGPETEATDGQTDRG